MRPRRSCYYLDSGSSVFSDHARPEIVLHLPKSTHDWSVSGVQIARLFTALHRVRFTAMPSDHYDELGSAASGASGAAMEDSETGPRMWRWNWGTEMGT